MLGEIMVGGALGVAAGYAGVFLGAAAGCSDHNEDFCGIGQAVVGGGLGLTVGATAGVMMMGHDAGYDASASRSWAA